MKRYAVKVLGLRKELHLEGDKVTESSTPGFIAIWKDGQAQAHIRLDRLEYILIQRPASEQLH